MKTQTFDSGAQGATITAANSASSGSAIASTILTGSAPVAVYDTAAAFAGAKGLTVSGAEGDNVSVSITDTANGSARARIYLYISAATAPTGSSVSVARIRSSTANMAIILLSTARVLSIQNAVGTSRKNFNTNTTLPDGWYRIELRVTKGTTTANGSIWCDIFRVASSESAPLDSFTGAGTENTGTADATTLQFGKPTTAGVVPGHKFDEIAFETGSTALIGPAQGAVDERHPNAINSNPGGWTQYGAAASHVAGLSDADNSTGSRSPDDPIGAAISYDFLAITPNTPVRVSATHYASVGDGQISRKYDLMQGATVIATRTVTLTTDPTDYSFVTTTAETAAITSWSALIVRVTDTKV